MSRPASSRPDISRFHFGVTVGILRVDADTRTPPRQYDFRLPVGMETLEAIADDDRLSCPGMPAAHRERSAMPCFVGDPGLMQ
jgi:hypothetical protein